MKKILISLYHPDEWNQLLPYNSYIHEIKDKYSKVISVVPYKGYILMSECDEILTVNDGDFFSYPSVLDTPIRYNHDFLKKCVDYCLEKYGVDNIEIKSYQKTKYDNGVVDQDAPPIDYYKTSISYAKKFFDNRLIIKPTELIFNSVKQKYGHLFSEKTFILLTRNFKTKALGHNTKVSLPSLGNLLKKLTENDIKIINIGFPPESYNIDKNYYEINESLTQDELISLFYLSYGVLTCADAGGFITHFGSNVDFFILNQEWSMTHQDIQISLIKSKKTNLTYDLTHLSQDEIIDCLLKNGKVQQKEFSIPKKINLI